ncbi:MAG TPA: hypothetical protein VM733_12735 [Thermoanaerobaculia bacterium]|nr:hypothetical protein [Thermoanaerobaculia bacterium]
MSTEIEVRRAFEHWARSRPGCTRRPADAIENIAFADEYVALISTHFEGRRAAWRVTPTSARARPPAPNLAAKSDPWIVDEHLLRQQSDHVDICDGCGGEGKSACAACNGYGKIVCGACRGERKVYGYAANGARRLLNCQHCRGKGEIDCAHCRRGIAVCARCGGERRVQRWLEIERWSRSDVREHPPAIARRLRWTGTVSNSDVERDGILATDVERARAIAHADAPTLPRQWLDLLPAAHEGERVERQRLRIVRIPRVIVTYTVGRTRADAEFAGRALHPPPPEAYDAFRARATHLRGLALLLAIVFVIATVITFARGFFYWSSWSVIAMAALFTALVSAWLAAAYARRWLYGALAGLLLSGIFTWVALPSPAHAARSIAAGNLDAAQRELEALGEKDHQPLWADLHLARIRGLTDPAAAQHELEAISKDLPQYEAALARYLALAYARAAEATSRANALTTARERLDARIAAERAWMDWELASGRTNTPELIALRTAMTADVAALEHEWR